MTLTCWGQAEDQGHKKNYSQASVWLFWMSITQQEEIGLLSLAQQDEAMLPSTDLDQDTEYPGEPHKPAPSLPFPQIKRRLYVPCFYAVASGPRGN